MKTTNNLFLIGFMGAGKSSVSAALGKKLGWNVIEMDERIAADEGMSIPEIFAQKQSFHYVPAFSLHINGNGGFSWLYLCFYTDCARPGTRRLRR